jgi:putative membrane protein
MQRPLQSIKGKTITTYQQVEIDNTLTRLCDAMGKCERIKTPFSQQLIALYSLYAACLSYSCRLD